MSFLRGLLAQNAFAKAQLTTAYLEKHPVDIPQIDTATACMLAAGMDFIQHKPHAAHPLACDTFSWQAHAPLSWPLYYTIDIDEHALQLTPLSPTQFHYQHQKASDTLHVQFNPKTNYLMLESEHLRIVAYVASDKAAYHFYDAKSHITVFKSNPLQKNKTAKKTQNSLNAPMPATVVAILKNKGEQVKAGEQIVVLEAMKMEHTINAPEAGELTDIFYPIGAQVNEGEALVALKPATQSEEA